MNLVYPGEKLVLAVAALLSLLVWAALGLVLTWGLLILLVVLGVVSLLARSKVVARLRGDGVRLGALQLTDLNGRLLGVCRRLNLEGAPEMVLLSEDGTRDAMAASFLGRDYLVLHGGVVQALEPFPAALDFYMGHAIGALKRDREMWRVLLLPARFIPVIGAAIERAAIYSNDRQGLAACENQAYAKIALAAMATGGTNWKKVNLRTWEEQLPDIRGFWCSYHELTGDRPWLVKRIAAIAALSEKQEPKLPARNPLAWLPALLTPRLPTSGSAALNLVVVATLAAVFMIFGLPRVQEFQRAQAVDAAYVASKPVRDAIEVLSSSQLRFPTLEELGENAQMLQRGVGMEARIQATEGGRIAILFSGGGELDGRTLLLYAEPLEGNYRALDWKCSGELPPQLRPKRCEWVEVDAAATMHATRPEGASAPESVVAPAGQAASPVPTATAAPAAPAVDEQRAAIAAELNSTRGDPAAMTLFNRMMVANAIRVADEAKVAAQRYHQDNKAWPKSVAEIGYQQNRFALDNDGSVAGALAMAKGGVVTVTIENGVFSGRVLSFKPRIQGQLYSWSCSGGGIPAEYLADGCR